jgi:hypothetical protein
MNSCIGRTSIDEKTRMKLWAISGGRCEMCNRILYEDSAFGVEGNFGEMAHIHAVSDNGPRNKRGMTSEEKNNIENLMLLCSEHHHMVDTKPEEFGEGLLKIKKKNHEDRIRRVTDIPEEESCRIVSYFSNIDKYEEYSSDRLFKEALLFSGKLPMQQPTINLNANTNVRYAPSKEEFERKASDLEREFKIWFDDIIKQQDSVGLFALAPQPLLFKLGSLINDQYNVSVYQCHRRANKWSWLKNNDEIEFKFYKTLNNNDDEIALVIDLSAEVDDERITSVLGDNISVFHLSVEAPNRNFVTNENIQSAFVECFRKAMEELKNLKNSKGVIHVFPVMPNSLAIKAGMDYMSKADLPLVVYEQSKATEGFFEALTIGG